MIQIDSSSAGAEKDENVERLLRVEHADEPTEIVIHVNMLKEGWDVTNLYTIVPFRSANARVLIEQSIGRGLWLPYGTRTGAEAVDRLSIVAHDRFQEIVDEAKKADSPIRMKSVVLDPEELAKPTKTVIAPPNLESKLGIRPANVTGTAEVAGSDQPPAFENLDDQRAAQLALAAIRGLSAQPDKVADLGDLRSADVQTMIHQDVVDGGPGGSREARRGRPLVPACQRSLCDLRWEAVDLRAHPA